MLYPGDWAAFSNDMKTEIVKSEDILTKLTQLLLK